MTQAMGQPPAVGSVRGHGRHYDVAVVGLGPVGAVAAQLLELEGLKVLAVDAQLQPYDKPRAIAIDHEALRLLQKLGVAQSKDFELGSYKATEYRNGAGQLLRRIKPAPGPHTLAWPPSATFVQPQLEILLRRRLLERQSITTCLGTRLLALAQTPQTVDLTLEAVDGSSGQSWQASADFVLACDGASSTVRDRLGMKLEDLQFDEPWLVVDVLVSDDEAVLPATTVQYCDPARPCTFIEGPGRLRRWEIMLLPGEDPADMVDHDTVWKLLSRWLRPGQGEIWRAATYRFHALVGHEWRRGRVFLAGDAAHQTPPFMGQGLNQGFRDVANLCWKLGEVAPRGRSTRLLDTYECERRPNAREVIELTKTLGRLICERDAGRAIRRDAELLAEMSAGRGELVRQDLLPPIRGGFLHADPGGAKPTAIGRPFPQPWLATADGLRRMDDVIHARFLLVSIAPDDVDDVLRQLAGEFDVALLTPVATGGAPAPRGWQMIVDEGALIVQWMGRHEATVALVRPDHVVFGVGARTGSASDLMRAMVAQLRG